MKQLPAPHPNRGVGPMNWDGHPTGLGAECPCKPFVRKTIIKNGRIVAAKPDEVIIQHRELPGQYGRTAEEIEVAEAAELERRRNTPDIRRHVKSGARW